MATIAVVRSIDAPAEVVFRAIADPQRFAQAVVGVTKLEILSDVASGAGTRYRQTRTLKGKESTMDFEITECVANERVRIVNETHGTIWDSVFTLTPAAGATQLTMRMDTKSRDLVPRLLMPLICLLIRGAVAKDLNDLKTYCEKPEG